MAPWALGATAAAAGTAYVGNMFYQNGNKPAGGDRSQSPTSKAAAAAAGQPHPGGPPQTASPDAPEDKLPPQKRELLSAPGATGADATLQRRDSESLSGASEAHYGSQHYAAKEEAPVRLERDWGKITRHSMAGGGLMFGAAGAGMGIAALTEAKKQQKHPASTDPSQGQPQTQRRSLEARHAHNSAGSEDRLLGSMMEVKRSLYRRSPSSTGGSSSGSEAGTSSGGRFADETSSIFEASHRGRTSSVTDHAGSVTSLNKAPPQHLPLEMRRSYSTVRNAGLGVLFGSAGLGLSAAALHRLANLKQPPPSQAPSSPPPHDQTTHKLRRRQLTAGGPVDGPVALHRRAPLGVSSVVYQGLKTGATKTLGTAAYKMIVNPHIPSRVHLDEAQEAQLKHNHYQNAGLKGYLMRHPTHVDLQPHQLDHIADQVHEKNAFNRKVGAVGLGVAAAGGVGFGWYEHHQNKKMQAQNGGGDQGHGQMQEAY